MNKIVLNNHDMVSEYASDEMIKEVESHEHSTFVLASGQTPTTTYRLFCEKFKKKHISSDTLTIILLDEWYGFAFGHEQSCYRFILDNVVVPLGMPMEQYLYLKSDCENPEQECKKFQEKINGLRIDMCVLGLGLNGHIGFNEPDDVFYPHTHFTVLSETSYDHPMALGNHEIIKGGLTLGIKNILSARKIFLLATGKNKASIVAKLCENDTITSKNPVSILKLHSHCEFVIDKEADRKE